MLGALEIGLIFSLVALGVYISFRLLRFPDLTVDGSFPLGGAVAATLIAAGYDPFTSTIVATIAGALAGLITGWLNVRLKIMDLLASILMMIALYSINLRIMGKPNVPLITEPTIFNLLQPEAMADYVFRPLTNIIHSGHALYKRGGSELPGQAAQLCGFILHVWCWAGQASPERI